MLRSMTSRAGIQPHLTNHTIRANTVTVLSAANYKSQPIKAITGHQSEASIESYSSMSTFQQFKVISNAIADFVDSGCSSADPSAALVADSTGKIAVSSSTTNYFKCHTQTGQEEAVRTLLLLSIFK